MPSSTKGELTSPKRMAFFTDIDSVEKGEEVHKREEWQQVPVDLSPQSGDDSRVRVEVMMDVFVCDLLVVLFVHPDPGLAPPPDFDRHVLGVVSTCCGGWVAGW